MSADAARIRITGLGKSYGALKVFRDINLDVGATEIVSILGPSGCGKTTLLRAIDGLLPYDDGEVRIEGQLVREPLRHNALTYWCERLPG